MQQQQPPHQQQQPVGQPQPVGQVAQPMMQYQQHFAPQPHPGAPPPHMDPTQQQQYQQQAMRAQQMQQQQLAAYHMQTQHLAQQHQQQLRMFWQQQMQEIETDNDFKNHQLPLARIKKIMKSDEDVRMISSEAPVLFAKACEMFILELTLRSWIHSEENKRRTLQRNDIAAAITKTDIFDFLVDIVPRDDFKEEGAHMQGVPRPPTAAVPGPEGAAGAATAVPAYSTGMYYMQPHPGQPGAPPAGMQPGAWPPQQMPPATSMPTDATQYRPAQ